MSMLGNQFPEGVKPQGESKNPHYYTALGRSADFLLRCKDCKRLVTIDEMSKVKSCPCGNKRFAQISTLSTWEWFKIRVGILDFPYRREFIKEFSRVR